MTLASLWNSGIQSSWTGPKWTPRTTIVPPGATSSPHLAKLASRPRRLDDDVVDARPRRRARPGARPPPSGRGGGPRARPSRAPSRRAPGHGQQAERAGADHRDAGARAGPGEPERVPRDGGRLDDGRVTHVEARRQRDQPRRRRAELLGHPPVGADAECSLTVGRAQVVCAALALRALHAAVDGLDDHGRAVLAHAGELVTEDGPAPESDVAQVGAADAGRPHVEQFADARRLVELDDRHSTLHTADSLHGPPNHRYPRGPRVCPGGACTTLPHRFR